MKDEDWMEIAIKYASKTDYPYGAIIVKNDKLVSGAGTRRKDSLDPTAHAEITAIRNACKKLKSSRLNNCVIYTTCEPCPMCFTACWLTGIKRIVYGMTLTDSSRLFFQEIDISSYQLNKKSGNSMLIKGKVLRDKIVKLFNK